MQSDMLEKCIAISQSHFLYVPYKDLTIDQIYGVDGIGNKASRICHYCSVDVLKNIFGYYAFSLYNYSHHST